MLKKNWKKKRWKNKKI